MRTWKITGTLNGQSKTVTVQASNWNEAVRKGSHAPHMLVVYDVILVN